MEPVTLPQLRELRCLYTPEYQGTPLYGSLFLAFGGDKIPKAISLEGERPICTHSFKAAACDCVQVIFLIPVTKYLTEQLVGESFIWFITVGQWSGTL